MTGLAGMFGFMLIPAGVLVLSAVLGTMTKIPKTGEAMLQHFAGGVVLSAVASELVPEMKKTEASIWAIVLGFLLGVTMLLIIRKIFPEEDEDDSDKEDRIVRPDFQRLEETEGSVPWGSVIPTLIDLLCDGMLVGLSFAAPVASAGVILAISIALEMASLGAALLISMKKSGVDAAKAVMIIVALAVAMTLSGVGSFLAADAIQVSFKQGYYAALAFGIAACLWLACEDLLMEAHENEDEKWFVTAMFFIGFLIPILLDKLSEDD
mmetsp:Transcript_58181/g.101888  ORF Transcript_58181/g.101888 Transcript_58181/m.101888 type:complete len:266 (+) Transcript_58181:80-877(+)